MKTRLSWIMWGSLRVSTSTTCLDLEMSWCRRLRSKSRLSMLVGQGSFVKFLRRKSWSGSRIQQRLVEQNMINRKLRLVMDGVPRPRACHGALNFTPHGGKRLRAMAVCTFGMCTLARRSGTRRRTMRARTNTSTLRMWRKTTQGESAHDSMAVFGQ